MQMIINHLFIVNASNKKLRKVRINYGRNKNYSPPLNGLSLSYILLEDQTWKNESNLKKNLYYQSVNKDQEKYSLNEFRNQNAISKYLKNEKYQELEKKKNLNFVIRILNQNNYFFCNQTQENFLVVNYHC